MTPVELDATVAVMLSWLLTYAVHSTILLGVAALVAMRLAAPEALDTEHAWLDVLWKTALVGPLVTASIQIGSDTIPLGGRWPLRASPQVVGAPGVTVAPLPAAATAPDEALGLSASPEPERADRGGAPAPETSVRAVRSATASRWWLAAVLAWLVLAATALVRFALRLLRLHRLVGSGPTVSTAHLREAVEALRTVARERAPVQLTTSGACAVPLALTGRRIVVPDRFLVELDAEDQRAALAHEMAHVVRRDPAWRIVAGAIERLFFFQPLNRLARARLCDSAEFLCDQWAVQQTREPLALARCLSIVASWTTPADDVRAADASAMARGDSPFVRRVTRILNESPLTRRRPSAWWLALPLALVVLAAPRVTAARLAAGPEAPAAPAERTHVADAGGQKGQPTSPRIWSADEIARARNRLRLHASPRPGDSLDTRWKQALADAARQGLSSFWLVYTFATPTHAKDLMITDTIDGSMVSMSGGIEQVPDLVPLAGLLGIPAAAGGAGNVTVLLHYRGNRADSIDRAGYRSARLGFDFGRTPVFSLGTASDAESFERVRQTFTDARNEKVRLVLIELASLHPDSDTVLPFLTRLVEPANATAIRQEAAEGFGHHNDPRSVETLVRVARTDDVSDVRAEAAETIGEVQTPQSIPALTDLANTSTDPAVRREAAEAFGDQPPALALPAIEHLLQTSDREDVLAEAIEALGELQDARATDLLVRTATTHPNPRAQQEAVETLGDRSEPAAVTELERIVREHPSPRLRREALDAIAHAASGTTDAGLLDRIEQTIERAIFTDPDRGVRKDAIDALGELPRDRASRVLLKVIEGHPDADVRQGAKEKREGR